MLTLSTVAPTTTDRKSEEQEAKASPSKAETKQDTVTATSDEKKTEDKPEDKARDGECRLSIPRHRLHIIQSPSHPHSHRHDELALTVVSPFPVPHPIPLTIRYALLHSHDAISVPISQIPHLKATATIARLPPRAPALVSTWSPIPLSSRSRVDRSRRSALPLREAVMPPASSTTPSPRFHP